MKSVIKLSALTLALSASTWTSAASNVVVNNDASGGLVYTTTGSVEEKSINIDTENGHFEGSLGSSKRSNYNPLNWARWTWDYFFKSSENEEDESEEMSVTFQTGAAKFVGKSDDDDNLIFEVSSTDAETNYQITGNGTANINISVTSAK